MRALRLILGTVFMAAGLLHLVRPKPYEQMMPDWIPLHREAVLVSGVAEAAGGAALLFDRTARPGCWWLIATLLAVFPANVQMALDPEGIPWVSKMNLPGALFWARLPLQAVLIAVLLVVTRGSLERD